MFLGVESKEKKRGEKGEKQIVCMYIMHLDVESVREKKKKNVIYMYTMYLNVEHKERKELKKEKN